MSRKLDPGANLEWMRRQHLDAYGITHGIMNPLGPSGQGDQNSAFSAALATAINHWQIAAFTDPEPRLRPSICVPYEDAEASAADVQSARAASKVSARNRLNTRSAAGLA